MHFYKCSILNDGGILFSIYQMTNVSNAKNNKLLFKKSGSTLIVEKLKKFNQTTLKKKNSIGLRNNHNE